MEYHSAWAVAIVAICAMITIITVVREVIP